MTHDEFMGFAKGEIEEAIVGQRNRLMNLVERAWSEGKKHAETAKVAEIIEEAMSRLIITKANENLNPQPNVCPATDPILNPPFVFTCGNCGSVMEVSKLK